MEKKKNTGQRLVAYYRYSGGSGQTEASIEGQRRDCEAWARLHGLEICHEYIDRHISGKTDNRAQFQQMMEDSDKHAFALLICWKTDRLARNRYDSAIYKNRLRKNGVKILYAAESSVEGPEGIILEGLMEALAEYYSAELSQKLRRGQRESALKCHVLGGYYALGLTVNKQHEFVIDESQAPTVKYIFERYAAGESAATIVAQLNSSGRRTARGQLFNKNSVLRIITNEQYIGTYTSKAHGVRVENAIPAIIERDLWDRAQTMLAHNRANRARRSTRANFMLSGKLFCGCCNTAMKGISGTGRHGDKHYYYSCPRRTEKICDKHNIEKNFLEDLIVSATADHILAPGKLEQIADRMIEIQKRDLERPDPEKQCLEAELAENVRRQANLLRTIEEGAASAKLSQRLQELEQREATLRYQLDLILAQPKAPVFTREQLLFMLEQFRRAPDEQDVDFKSRLLNTFVSSVQLTDDKVLVQFAIQDAEDRKSSTLESVLLDLERSGDPENFNDNSQEFSRFDRVSSGGGDGSRTHVRKEFSASISGCRRSMTFPLRYAGRQA